MWTLLQPRTRSREQITLALLRIRHLVRDADWQRADPAQGGGLGVVLVPGFGFPDLSLAMTSKWLAARGYRPIGARIGLNVGCTTELVDRIEQRMVQHAEATGGPVVLMGQSRGGWLARLAAVRRPDLVRGLVMFGTPVLDPMGAKPKVVQTARFLTRLSSFGLPGLLREDCLSGPCFESNSAALAAELPFGLPALSVYSRSDGIVPWQLCLDPCAECVEIDSSHIGMGFEPDLYRVLEHRLAQWASPMVPSSSRTHRTGPRRARRTGPRPIRPCAGAS
jgi:pimeloyl-ACP methyl ester carboxylesterase